jgi:hypothetical protein
MAQSCPGWPWGGFSLAVDPELGVLVAAGFITGAGTGAVVCTEGAVVLPGALFNGAPTEISHLWPGKPCSGFNPAPAVIAGVWLTGTGLTPLLLGARSTAELLDGMVVMAGEAAFKLSFAGIMLESLTGASLPPQLLKPTALIRSAAIIDLFIGCI